MKSIHRQNNETGKDEHSNEKARKTYGRPVGGQPASLLGRVREHRRRKFGRGRRCGRPFLHHDREWGRERGCAGHTDRRRSCVLGAMGWRCGRPDYCHHRFLQRRNNAEKGTNITYVCQADLVNAYQAASLAGDVPDIMLWDANEVRRYAKMGQLRFFRYKILIF